MEEINLDDEELTTVQISKGTLRKLGLLAKAHERTKAAQIRFWVNRDYAELEQLKLLPKGSEELPQVDAVA